MKLSVPTRFEPGKLVWQQLPAPLPIRSIKPEEIVQDILEATLVRVQKTANLEVAAEAARCLTVLRGNRAQGSASV